MRWGRAFAGIVSGLVVVSTGISGLAAHAATGTTESVAMVAQVPHAVAGHGTTQLGIAAWRNAPDPAVAVLRHVDVQVTAQSGLFDGSDSCTVESDRRSATCWLDLTGSTHSTVPLTYHATRALGSDELRLTSSYSHTSQGASLAIGDGPDLVVGAGVGSPGDPPTVYHRGETFTGWVNVSNVGNATAHHVVVTLSADPDIRLRLVGASSGCDSQGLGSVSCAIGDLAVGPWLRLTFDATLPTDRPLETRGTLPEATATADEGNVNPADGQAAIWVRWDLSGGVDVAVTAVLGRKDLAPGVVTTIDVTIRNVGTVSTEAVNYKPGFIIDVSAGMTSADPRCPLRTTGDLVCRATSYLLPGEETTFHVDYTVPQYPTTGIVGLLADDANPGNDVTSFDFNWLSPTNPSTPLDLAFDSVTEHSLTLSWTAPSDPSKVASYDVYRDGQKVGNVAATAYVDNGLEPGTDYTYTVVSVDAAGHDLATSNESTATTRYLPNPPAPVNFRALSVGSTAVRLAWDDSPNAAPYFLVGYDIYKWSSREDGTRSAHTITLRGLDPGRTYKFSVRARDLSGHVSDPATISVTTSKVADTVAPTVPTNVRVLSTGSTSVRIGWTAATDNVAVTGYDVLVDGDRYSGTTSSMTVTLTGLRPKTTYSVRVRAKDANDNLSPASSAVSVTTTA